MIVLIHKDNKVVNVVDTTTNTIINVCCTVPLEVLFELSKQHPHELIIWCHHSLKEVINTKGIQEIFHHKRIMASFEVRDHHYISGRIGYVESSPFVNVNKKVTYPTWLMSSCVGGIYAEALLKFRARDFKKDCFDYALNAMAKQGIRHGLFCYSAPKLLQAHNHRFKPYKNTSSTLFKFIKQHYKSRWTAVLLFNVLVYEKKLFLLPFIASFFVSKKKSNPNFKAITVKSTKSPLNNPTVDVVIPTIGRKPYLYKVLQDLSQQTLLPTQVIIVEQNPDLNSQSELDYLTTENWPFKIIHTFIRQTGACNARNIALKQVTAAFVFLADDDIRFNKHVLQDALSQMEAYGLKAATLSCLKAGETETIINNMSWHTFGSGCSIIKTEMLENLAYDTAYEHGFGEDGDFGMQIRNLGEDIGYLSNVKLQHLKAPIGGFRTPFVHPWEAEAIKPKPSPTVMLFNLKHRTKCQLLGYKTLLFFKFFKVQPNKNMVTYLSQMRKRWDKSVFWAHRLKTKHI